MRLPFASRAAPPTARGVCKAAARRACGGAFVCGNWRRCVRCTRCGVRRSAPPMPWTTPPGASASSTSDQEGATSGAAARTRAARSPSGPSCASGRASWRLRGRTTAASSCRCTSGSSSANSATPRRVSKKSRAPRPRGRVGGATRTAREAPLGSSTQHRGAPPSRKEGKRLNSENVHPNASPRRPPPRRRRLRPRR